MKDKMKLNLIFSSYILTALFMVYIRFSGHILYNKIYPFLGFFYMLVPVYLFIRALIYIFSSENLKQALILRINFGLVFIICIVNYKLLNIISNEMQRDSVIKMLLQDYWHVYGAIYTSVFVAIFESFGKLAFFYATTFVFAFANLVLFGKILGFVVKRISKYFSAEEKEKRNKKQAVRDSLKHREKSEVSIEAEVDEIKSEAEKEHVDEELYIKVKNYDDENQENDEQELIKSETTNEMEENKVDGNKTEKNEFEVHDKKEMKDDFETIKDKLEEAPEEIIGEQKTLNLDEDINKETESSTSNPNTLIQDEVIDERDEILSEDELINKPDTESNQELSETVETENSLDSCEESESEEEFAEVLEPNSVIKPEENIQETEVLKTSVETENNFPKSEAENVKSEKSEDEKNENKEEDTVSDSNSLKEDFSEQHELKEEEQKEKLGFFQKLIKGNSEKKAKIRKLREKQKERDELRKQEQKELQEKAKHKYQDELIEIKPKKNSDSTEPKEDKLSIKSEITIADDNNFEEEIVLPHKTEKKDSLAEAQERIKQLLAESSSMNSNALKEEAIDKNKGELLQKAPLKESPENIEEKLNLEVKSEKQNEKVEIASSAEDKLKKEKTKLPKDKSEDLQNESPKKIKKKSKKQNKEVKHQTEEIQKLDKNEDVENHIRYEQVPLSFSEEKELNSKNNINEQKEFSKEGSKENKSEKSESTEIKEEVKEETKQVETFYELNSESKKSELKKPEVIVKEIKIEKEFEELGSINDMKKAVAVIKSDLMKLGISETEFEEAKIILDKFPNRDLTFYQRKFKRGLLKTQEIVEYLKEGMK